MHKKIWLLLGSIFLGVGIVLSITVAVLNGVTAMRHGRVRSDSVPVTAQIIEITRGVTQGGNAHHTAFIEYEFEGEVFTAQLRWWSSRMYVGQPVEIYVNRYNPREFVHSGILDILPFIIMLPIAVVFNGLGVGFLAHHSRKKKRHRWLLDFGTPVWANVLGFEENWSIQINGRPATVLVATYNNMKFISGPLDNNDRANIGEHVKVLLHPEDNNKYTFDFANESYLMPLEPPVPLQERTF